MCSFFFFFFAGAFKNSSIIASKIIIEKIGWWPVGSTGPPFHCCPFFLFFALSSLSSLFPFPPSPPFFFCFRCLRFVLATYCTYDLHCSVAVKFCCYNSQTRPGRTSSVLTSTTCYGWWDTLPLSWQQYLIWKYQIVSVPLYIRRNILLISIQPVVLEAKYCIVCFFNEKKITTNT